MSFPQFHKCGKLLLRFWYYYIRIVEFGLIGKLGSSLKIGYYYVDTI